MKNPLNSTFDFLGRNENSATIVACLIAVFKGTFRPIFTMMDKSQDPKTKKYAAIREGLTEVAAFPLYAATPILVGHLVDKLYKGNEMKRVKGTSKFLGLCLATTLIPVVCNIIQPPIMNAIKRHNEKNENPVVQPTVQNPTIQKPKTQVASFSGKMNYGMKVGG